MDINEKKIRAKEIVARLAVLYPNPVTELHFDNAFQLLVSVMLSAQCTDARVNTVTPALFEVAPTAEDMARLPIERIEELIHSCGFYHNKARSISETSRDIVTRFGGKVPETMEELTSLRGVGRKTANVVCAVGFGRQAIAVDTHVYRVSHRLELSDSRTPTGTELQLSEILDKERLSDSHHYLLLFGRYICKARKPDCGQCPLTDICRSGDKTV